MAATRSHRFNAESKRGDRAAMAAPAPTLAYLHIQTDDDAPTRVLELGATPVRIGRGIQCEVRLNQVGLGDVQCLIRRRNDEWQMQPVGPPGRIWLDNRSTDQQRALPVGVPLRVGRATLMIQLADPANQARGSFDAPITVNAEPIEAPTPPPPPAVIQPPVAFVPEPEPEPEPDPEPVILAESEPEVSPTADPSPAGPVDDRVQRWQSRLDQRDRWLKDRQSEKRWEARWKAAGETIRARSGQPATPPAAEPPSGSPRPSPEPTPTATPTSLRPPIVGRSAPIRTFEPRPVFGHSRRVIEPEPRVEPNSKSEPILAELSEPTPQLPDHPPAVVVWTQPEPIVPPAEAAQPVVANPVVLAESTLVFEDHEPKIDRDSRELDIPPVSVHASLTGRVASDLHTHDETADLGHELNSTVAEVDSSAIESETLVDSLVKSSKSSPSTLDAITPGPDVASIALASPVETTRPTASSARPARESVGPRRRTAPVDPAAKAWPSAQAILAAQGTRATAAITPTRQATSRQAPEPTTAEPPQTWAVPFALGWLPTLALVLGVGCFTIGLAGIWVGDATSGNLAIRLATRLEARSPTIDPDSLPQSAWWRTTASHLAAWSIALERVGNGEDRTADARALESDARVVSPLGARARFVAEPVAGQEGDGMLTIRLGPTRDVVTLTAMGHRLRREGKRADAIRAYQAAFLTAASTPRSTLGKPVFAEESPTHRYSLPHAMLLDPVARDMADAGEWTAEEWAAVVPDFGPARLAVANALRTRQPAEADRLLDLLCKNRGMAPDSRFEVAEHHAAIAEALAARDRWGDAIAAYHRAIDDEPRDLDRRVWWFNLAELAGKNGESDMRNQAIENAKGLDLSDEVTQRAANANQLAPDSNLNARNP